MYQFYQFEEDDGGRAAAGFRGYAKDCAIRAVAIALDLPYRQIHREITELQRCVTAEPDEPNWKTAQDGINLNYLEFGEYLSNYGVLPIRVPKKPRLNTVLAKLNLLAEEPFIIAQVTNHLVAITEGRIRDNLFDPKRYSRRLLTLYVPDVSEPVIRKRLELHNFL